MLRDEDIWRIASRHVGESYAGNRSPVLKFELDDPPGVYFGASASSPFELTGDGGFFISRTDGAIRHFGAGRILDSFKRRLLDDAQHDDAAAMRAAVRAVLTGAAVQPTPGTPHEADTRPARTVVDERPLIRVLKIQVARSEDARALSDEIATKKPGLLIVDLLNYKDQISDVLLADLIRAASAMSRLGNGRPRILGRGDNAAKLNALIDAMNVRTVFGPIYPDAESATEEG